jgi:hypothetical protein
VDIFSYALLNVVAAGMYTTLFHPAAIEFELIGFHPDHGVN